MAGYCSGAAVDLGARQTAVELAVAVSWPRPVRLVTGEIRSHVRLHLQELTGYAVTDVDIKIDAPPRSRRAGPGRVS